MLLVEALQLRYQVRVRHELLVGVSPHATPANHGLGRGRSLAGMVRVVGVGAARLRVREVRVGRLVVPRRSRGTDRRLAVFVGREVEVVERADRTENALL